MRSEALRGVAPGRVCFMLLGNSEAEMRQTRQQSRLGDNQSTRGEGTRSAWRISKPFVLDGGIVTAQMMPTYYDHLHVPHQHLTHAAGILLANGT